MVLTLYISRVRVDTFLVKKVYYGHEINENKHYLQQSKINTREQRCTYPTSVNYIKVCGYPYRRVYPNLWWHVSATLFFLPQHIIFSKNIVLRTWCTTQYLLKKECVVTQKVMYYDKLATTQYFLKNIVMWQQKNKVADTCHHIRTDP